MKTNIVPQDELNRRISLDFYKSKLTIRNELALYIKDVSYEQINQWTEDGSLEHMIIDNQTLYFHSAVKNLLRTNKDLNHYLTDAEGKERAGRQYILAHHIPNVIYQTIQQIKASKPMFSALPVTPIYGEFDPMGIFSSPIDPEDIHNPHLTSPINWKFFSRITVDADIVPEGEEIRCWMPMPRTDVNRQIFFDKDEVIEEGDHACRYFSKKAIKGEPTIFSNSFSFTSHAEYHPLSENFKHEALKPNEELDKYLIEEAPHIVFDEILKLVAKRIVKSEDRPYYQALSIFKTLRTQFPWASAREYSTIENIPKYVLNNRHGDCGQIALLFITLCRIIGIPARWQSGFMLHPGYENLHDWCEIYIQNLGWIPVDPSFSTQHWGNNELEQNFFFGGIDAFRLVVNSDWGAELLPNKRHPRSETIDFQRGEVEWREGNIYFDKFRFQFWAEPCL